MALRHSGDIVWNCVAQGCVQALLAVMDITQLLVVFRFSPLTFTAQLKEATADDTVPPSATAVPPVPTAPAAVVAPAPLPPGVSDPDPVPSTTPALAAAAAARASAAFCAAASAFAAAATAAPCACPSAAAEVDAPVASAGGAPADRLPELPPVMIVVCGAAGATTGGVATVAPTVAPSPELIASGDAAPPAADAFGMGGRPHFTFSDCTFVSQKLSPACPKQVMVSSPPHVGWQGLLQNPAAVVGKQEPQAATTPLKQGCTVQAC
mmetsp:Transcript_7297/g.21487  ORF Transcript_7297/g.21487 Transcript_7297/m.21487 type:complete len:266 (+) Transcript_7297:1257-2054(+)